MAEELAIRIHAIDDFSKTFAAVGTKMRALGQGMQRVGSSLTRYVSLPILGIGIAGIKAAADFEQSMSNVRSVTNASKKDMNMMEQAAVTMAGKYKGSAKDAADALYYIASAGYSAKDSASALQGVMSLASATNSDLAQTSEDVMAAISMFGLKASETTRIADVYAKACQISQAEMGKLAASMRYAGPIANTLGWSLEQTTAALSRLYDGGLKGEQAGTALRAALSRLIDPSKEVTDTLNQMGISSEQLATAMKNPADLIDLFRSRSITAQQAVALFGQEAGPGMMTLLQKGGDAIRDYEDKLNKAAGTADRAAKIQMDNLKGKLEKVKDAFEALSISLAKNQGALDTLANLLDKAAKFLDKLTPKQQESVVKFGAMAAAAGPLIWILGKIIAVGTILASWFGKIATFLSGPLGLAMLLVGATIAGGLFFDKLPAWAKILLTLILPFTFVIDKIKDFVNKVKDMGGVSKVWDKISSAWESGVGKVGTAVSNIWQAIKNKFNEMVEGARQFGSDLMNALSETVLGHIVGVIASFAALGQAIITFMGTWILKGIEWGIGVIGNFISGMATKIAGLVTTVGGWMWTHIGQPIVSFAGSVFSKGVEIIGKFISGMYERISGLASTVGGWMIKHIGQPIISAAASAYHWGASIIEKFIEGLKSKIAMAGRMIRQLASQIESMTPGGKPTYAPAFQLGGVIRGAPSQPVKITAHGGEGVLTSTTMQELRTLGIPIMQPAAATTSSIIHTHVFLDGREVANSVNYHNSGVGDNL